jgi:guanylate kinase
VDVDVIGARSIRRNHPLAVFIFIVPPSLKELKRRLLERSTESEEQLKLRLDRIRDEIDQRNLFDYLIVNDRLDQALTDLIGLLQTERLRMDRAETFWPDFFSVS